MGLLHILFGFNGRIRRTTFWLAGIGWWFAAGFVWLAISIVAGVGAGVFSAGFGHFHSFFGLFFWPIYAPVGLLSLWVHLALGAKRCHDRNYPGVVILLAFLPVIGWLWWLIDLGFIDGTQGPNAYGTSPKGYQAAFA